MEVSQSSVTSLLVSSERKLTQLLSYFFKVVLKHNFEVVEGMKAARARLTGPDSVQVIFVHLSGKSLREMDLIKAAKLQNSRCVVIALNAGDPKLSVDAFFVGADDVVVWPCYLHELAVRLFVRLGQSVDRRSFPTGKDSWQIEAYIADRAGLTTSEAQVMRLLYMNEGEIVSRDKLSLAVDARPWRYGDRKFDVHIAKIRKKLLDSFGSEISVSTTRSSGYCLVTKGSDIFDPV
jgi:DNA-binding response OmpR family regulator